MESFTVSTVSHFAAYSDSDYAGDPASRRSTEGYLITYANGPIAWKTGLQKKVTLSSTEAEYVAMCSASKELAWLRCIALELNIIRAESILLNFDNTSAIKIAQNDKLTQHTRHMGAKEAYVEEQMRFGYIKLAHVKSNDQLAD